MRSGKPFVVIAGACLSGLLAVVCLYAWFAWTACAELAMQWQAYAGRCIGPNGSHDEYILVVGSETMGLMAVAGIVVGTAVGLLLRRAVAGRLPQNHG